MLEGLVSHKAVSTVFGAAGADKWGLSLADTLSIPTCPATVGRVCEAGMGQRAATSSVEKDNKGNTQLFKVHKVFPQSSAR